MGATRCPCFLIPVLPYQCRLFRVWMKQMKKAKFGLSAKAKPRLRLDKVLTTV